MGHKHPQPGDVVKYRDSKGNLHIALVTCYFGQVLENGEYADYVGCANLVIVSSDERRTDQFGRQIERFTSIPHVSTVHVHGVYWRWADEQDNPVVKPSAT